MEPLSPVVQFLSGITLISAPRLALKGMPIKGWPVIGPGSAFDSDLIIASCILLALVLAIVIIQCFVEKNHHAKPLQVVTVPVPMVVMMVVSIEVTLVIMLSVAIPVMLVVLASFPLVVLQPVIIPLFNGLLEMGFMVHFMIG